MRNRIFVLGFITLLIFSTTGCGKKIFEDPNAKYLAVGVEDKDLKQKVFYVKNGAKFYATYTPNGGANGRTYWLHKDSTLIPTYYKGELLAYSTTDTKLDNISVERFEDIGYSIGLYGGVMDEDGYICFTVGQNTINNTDAANILSDIKSPNIRIISINGVKASKDMLSRAGTIKGFNKDDVLLLELYSGAYYGTVKIKVDTYYIHSYEMFQLDKARNTKNGFLAINMHEDMKSGFYKIKGGGFFRYYDFKKGEKDEETVNLNEAYYATEEERLIAYSQQYLISINQSAKNVKFVYDFIKPSNDEEVIGIITAPNGEIYRMNIDMESSSGELTLAEAMAGKWTLNVLPSDLNVKNVKAEALQTQKDATAYVEEFYFAEDSSNMKFVVSYRGDGEIWAVIENEQREAKEFELNKKAKTLTVEYPYLPAGTYKIFVYHYEDTEIEEIVYGENAAKYEEIIITIEG